MIAREGIPFVGAATLLTVIFAFLFGWSGGVPLGFLTLFVVYFFRDPERHPPVGPGLIVAPGDGKIIEVSELFEDRYLKAQVKKVVIFLSIFNVHVNRIPATGRIKKVLYNKGKFLIGYAPKASLENEQNGVVLETEEGEEIAFIQIAGFVARRILCYIKEGDAVARGARFGLIRFGSRVDLYLPLSYEVAVRPGDRVKGGESVMARLK